MTPTLMLFLPISCTSTPTSTHFCRSPKLGDRDIHREGVRDFFQSTLGMITITWSIKAKHCKHWNLFFKNPLGYLCPLPFHINFKICMSISTKNVTYWKNGWNCVDSIGEFREKMTTMLNLPICGHDFSLHFLGEFLLKIYHCFQRWSLVCLWLNVILRTLYFDAIVQ